MGYFFVNCNNKYSPVICWPVNEIDGYYCSLTTQASRRCLVVAHARNGYVFTRHTDQRVTTDVHSVVGLLKKLENLKKKIYEKN